MDDDNKNLSDTIKKLFTAGVSAAFLTEESIRNYVSELKLPKDMINLLLSSAVKSKEEFMGRVTRETVELLKKVDFAKEAAHFLETHKLKISAEVEFVKNQSTSE